MSGGIKARALAALAARGTVDFPRDLIAELGADEHNLVHALHRLRKEGLIECRQTGKPVAAPVRPQAVRRDARPLPDGHPAHAGRPGQGPRERRADWGAHAGRRQCIIIA